VASLAADDLFSRSQAEVWLSGPAAAASFAPTSAV
jgi:hypothetical protein